MKNLLSLLSVVNGTRRRRRRGASPAEKLLKATSSSLNQLKETAEQIPSQLKRLADDSAADGMKKATRPVKYTWALLLSLAVGALALTERDSPWAPLLNGLIDLLQQQERSAPKSPPAGEIPAGSGAFHLPARQEVEPGASALPAIAPGNVAAAHQ